MSLRLRHLLLGLGTLTLGVGTGCGDDSDGGDDGATGGTIGTGGGSPQSGGSGGTVTTGGSGGAVSTGGTGGGATGGAAGMAGGAVGGEGGAAGSPGTGGATGGAASGGTGGAAAGMCTGTPLACGSRMRDECGVGEGCTLSGSTPCSGATVKSCASSSTAQLCAIAPGCRWQGMCAGTPRPCDQIFAQTQCVYQGCTWTNPMGMSECVGTATACAQFDVEEFCEAQPGCTFN